jgi:hypothetical protein
LGNQAHDTNSFSLKVRFPPNATTAEMKILACLKQRIKRSDYNAIITVITITTITITVIIIMC